MAEPSSQPASAVTAGGVDFAPQLDVYSQYIAGPVSTAVATAEEAAATAARAVATAKFEAAAATEKAAQEAAAAQAAAAEEATAAAAAAEVKASKGGKDAKGKPAAAPKPKEASSVADKGGKLSKKAAAEKAAAEAAAAAAELPAPVFQFEFAGVKAPLDRSGAALCLEDSLPEDAIRQVLQTLQQQYLDDMVTFREETGGSGHSWAADQEVAGTEQLEARLRSHRYMISGAETLPLHEQTFVPSTLWHVASGKLFDKVQHWREMVVHAFRPCDTKILHQYDPS